MTEGVPRYFKPRVLLVDIPETVTAALKGLGLNVNSGTFGPRYAVTASSDWVLVNQATDLPDYEEQEIVVLDNSSTVPIPYPTDSGRLVASVPHVVAHCGYGLIDTRPMAMRHMQEYGDRILKAGGLFIIFACYKYQIDYKFNVPSERFNHYESIELNNWDFLSIFNKIGLSTHVNNGTEFNEPEQPMEIMNNLRQFTRLMKYTCSLSEDFVSITGNKLPKFMPILLSKYGDVVSGYILANNAGGAVLILPQIDDKAGLLVELFKNYLPSIHARLFTEHEGDRWVHREEYEHPAILVNHQRQLEIQRQADEAIDAIELEIAHAKSRLAFLHGLLTKSGDELVADVKTALEFIGFRKVVDVDAVEKDRVAKQEDLQVLDRSTKLLIEVKGLSGFPRENNTLQVTKFILRRIRNWVWPGEPVLPPHGVTLVNHQRGIPPLERDLKNVFTEAQVGDAIENGTGLMTTWDLFRLIRGMDRWAWEPCQVQDLFYEKGRIGELPPHYRPLGKIFHFFDRPNVVSVLIDDEMILKESDRVGYVFQDRFHEETVVGLQVDRREVVEATAGQKGAYRTELSASELKEGMVVYLANYIAPST